MKDERKVIVLGAGRGQVPLMNLFHNYGCKVITVSPKGNYPGFDIADDALYADIADKDIVLDYAKKEGIIGITTDQLDESVCTAAYVSEKMGLPGIGYNVALKFTNKFLMRKAAEQANIDVPFAVIVKSLREAKDVILDDKRLSLPVMIKPIASSASRGVFKITNINELDKLYNISEKYSKDSTVLIEQYIKGKEFVIEAFTTNYEVTNLVVGHRDYFNLPDVFIPCTTVFHDSISADSNLEKRLKSINEKIIKSFGLKFGITHAEYLYDEKSDKIFLVEIAARGGGVFISSDLIPAACGVNANELLVREILEIKDTICLDIHKGASAYYCYLLPPGEVKRLQGIDEVISLPGVIKAFFDNIQLGMISNSIMDKSSRKGPILVQAKNKMECYDIIQKVKELLDIKVLSKGIQKDIIWN